MTRIATLIVLGVLLLVPATAAAQFGFVPNRGGGVPYRQRAYVGITTYGTPYVGVNLPYNWSPQLASPGFFGYAPAPGPAWAPSAGMSAGSGYITGGSLNNDILLAAQRNFEQAQKNAGLARATMKTEAARDAIEAQRAYERLGVGSLPAAKAAKDHPEALQLALAVTRENEVASGLPLNHVLVAVVAAEAKGGKGVSAFLPPQLLDDIRFSGGASADAINLLRQSGNLPFPAAFAAPELKDIRAALEKDFAAVAAPLFSGKPVEPMKVVQLGVTLRKAQEASAPVIRNLAPDDAKASRKFLNQFESAVTALKGNGVNSLINPAWATDGANVADLVKYMTRHKLMFAPAPPTREDSYLVLHKGLATYLFVLTQPKK